MNSENELNEQIALAEKFINQTNRPVFLTGKAGTGKTTFLKSIIQTTHKKALVTAPTGIAALNAGGVTLHSQFQLSMSAFIPAKVEYNQFSNVRVESQSTLFRNMRMNEIKRRTIIEAELLIIDEVSMLRADTLDAIDFILRVIRKNQKPFGGLQVLFIGDLLQLPPIFKDEEWEILKNYYKSLYFFDAQVLKSQAPIYIELEKIYRQKDSTFTDLLNNLRYNKLNESNINLLNQHYKKDFKPSKADEYITLTTHNKYADQINQTELQQLKTPAKKYTAIVEGDFPDHLMPCEQQLILKVGAQVMFIKNDISGQQLYYNGKIGLVKEMHDDRIVVEVDHEEAIVIGQHEWKNNRFRLDEVSHEIVDEELGRFTQFPLRLAWAITIHKSQGLTFEKAIIDIKNVFASGQAYVALSRLTGLDGLVLTSEISTKGISNSKEVLGYEQSKILQGDTSTQLLSDQIIYLNDSCRRAFNFQSILEIWKSHVDSYTKEDEKSEKQQYLFWAKEQFNHILELYNLSEKFLIQVNDLLNKNDIQKLALRLNDAWNYFEERLKKISIECLKHLNEIKSLKRTKIYIKEIEELESMLFARMLLLKKVAMLADHMAHSKNLSKEIWSDSINLNWRKEFIQLIEKGEPKVKKAKEKKITGETFKITLAQFLDKKSIDEISLNRKLARGTIVLHIAKLIEKGDLKITDAISYERHQILEEKVQPFLKLKMAEIKSTLGDEITYDELHFILAFFKWSKNQKAE